MVSDRPAKAKARDIARCVATASFAVCVANAAASAQSQSLATGMIVAQSPSVRDRTGLSTPPGRGPEAQGISRQGGSPDGKAALPPTQQELQEARAKIRANPQDSRARFALAELLRRAGRHKEAAEEYLEVVDLQPDNYFAYHQLSVINAVPEQLDDAVARLLRVKEEKPRELMLRVALSELLEKRGQYYPAARTLVDLVYANAIPDKYQAKINARIHYLLTKARAAHNPEQDLVADEELDALPAPLPESSLRRDLAASKLKEPGVMRGVGNAPLLP